MDKLSNGKKAIQLPDQSVWFKWAKHHPGVILLGALVLAVLAYHPSPSTANFERDTNGQEVPLFI